MVHVPRKRFGQNFLHDHNVIQDILSSLQVIDNDHWVEIGPGLGALTERLLSKNIKLDIIELDWDLVAILKNKFYKSSNLEIHSADALSFEFSSLVKNRQKLRIVGNLPYNISTPLLFHLVKFTSIIEDMYFMLQKEVVDRICAAPGSKQYGKLTVMLQYYCQAEKLFDVNPESFNPAPKVMSSIIRLIPHKLPPVLIDDITNLNRIVTQAFSQRRKTLRNSLKKIISDEGLAELNIDPGSRTEGLTLADFAKISKFYSQLVMEK